MISSSCIFMTTERILNQWFLWKKRSGTRESRKNVFIDLTAIMNISEDAVKRYESLAILRLLKSSMFIQGHYKRKSE